MKSHRISLHMSDAARRQFEASLRRDLRRSGIKPDSVGIRKAARDMQRRINKK